MDQLGLGLGQGMNEQNEHQVRPIFVRSVHVALCITTSAARARLGVRLRIDQTKPQPRPSLEPVQSAGEGINTLTVSLPSNEA